MSYKRDVLISSVLILLFSVLSCFDTFAQSIPEKQNPPKLVNDFANLLSEKQTRALEKKLVRFNDTTSNQITIVTVNSLDGYSADMFAYEIGEKWKVGQKEFDNGIVILVKPKTKASDKGKAFIAVGYGLEPAIPDAIAKRIVENEMIPNFRNNDYYTGLNKATTVLMKLASGEISAEGYNKTSGNKGLISLLPFIVIIIVIVILRSSRSRHDSIGSRGSGGSGSLWTALWLGSMMGGGSSNSGSWGNFSGGGSGFGGGGGFGGFGGGGFGGGGAGGSW
jgi:uncharacterized protein